MLKMFPLPGSFSRVRNFHSDDVGIGVAADRWANASPWTSANAVYTDALANKTSIFWY